MREIRREIVKEIKDDLGIILKPHRNRPYTYDMPGHQQKAGKRKISNEILRNMDRRTEAISKWVRNRQSKIK